MNTSKKNIAVLGSLTVDLFVRPDISTVFHQISEHKKDSFFALPHGGKILADHIEEQMGGGASNVSASLKKQSINPFIFGGVGIDIYGERIKKNLEKNNINTNGIKTFNDLKSGFSLIINSFDGERTVIFTTEANKHFPYKFSKDDLINNTLDGVYLCHLSGEATHQADKVLSDFFDTHPEKFLAWNPGKEQIEQGVEKQKQLLRHTDILFLNKEESEIFTGEKAVASQTYGDAERKKHIEKTVSKLPSSVERVDHIAQIFFDKGVKIIVITDGRKGAQIFSQNESFFIPALGEDRVDTLGAGDSFASTFTAQYLQGKSLQKCAKYASIQASSVVSKVGAQPGLLNGKEISNILSQKDIPCIHI